MAWELEEAITYYGKQGAPSDQTMLVGLLKEIQQECGGISGSDAQSIAEAYKIKETFLQAIIKRYPSLKMKNTHCLELCAGPNCPKKADLRAFVEKTYGKHPEGFELKYGPCMRLCGKGPNLKWDGVLYNRADEALIRKLVENR